MEIIGIVIICIFVAAIIAYTIVYKSDNNNTDILDDYEFLKK